MTTINDYMTRTEAAHRWGLSENTLKERLKTRNAHNLEPHIAKGRIKQFKVPGALRGEWIITRELMEIWYGPEPEK